MSIKYLLFPICRIILSHYEFKYGISIPYNTEIGSGLEINHFGCIIVNSRSVIGKNCVISSGVTIGQTNRGERKGCPVIGDSVYIGPGVKIVGQVKVGNDVAIGANCVITKDIPDHAVMIGVSGKIVSYNGTKGYVNNTDY